jgi:glycosyltransferase involved in cell wall biosynthesis
MRTFFFIPPLNKITGGLIVICQLAEILHQAGHAVSLVVREKDPVEKEIDVPVMNWDDLDLKPSDLWMVPEGWPSALAPGLKAGCRNLVYVQNWAYLLSAMPESVKWNQLDVEFLAVSTPVAHFVFDNLGFDSQILRPGIDRELFKVAPDQGNSLIFGGNPPVKLKKINVAWMPRKNKAIAIQAMQILEERGRTKLPVNWVEIHGKPPDLVAAMLQNAHIFMGTGFPEGFGLPPLEAMACGAVPVSSAGYGGWGYLRPADLNIPALTNLPGFTPPAFFGKAGKFGELDLPFGPNAFIVPDADPISLAIAVEYAANLLVERDPLIGELLKNGQQTADALSFEKQKENVLALWDKFSAS